MYRLIIYILVLWIPDSSTGLQCTSSVPHRLKFSLLSRRNNTGHWTAKVKLEHEAGQKEVGPWEVDIDHTTEKCDNSDSVVIVATVTAPPQKPSSDYDLLTGLGYYKMHTKGTKWHDALRTCEEEGAHLAILNSEQEALVLAVMWQKHPKLFGDWRNEWAYIGAHDINVEGEYVTIFNQPLNSTGYSKWQSGQPNGGNCLVILRKAGTLGDVACTDQLAFFCEKEL